MGRPKGSKNKPKVPAVAVPQAIDPSTLPAPAVKRRGRPAAQPATPAPQPPATTEVPKRRGRPPGSKNKPKDGATTVTPPAPTPTPPAATATSPASTEIPKRRGRPPKVVVPTVSVPPVTPAATVTPTPPTQITRTDSDEEAAEASAPVEKPSPYTLEQLNDPALDELTAHATALFEKASASRKLFFEEKVRPGLTVEKAVLKVLVDFLEINVPNTIAQNGKAKGKEKAGG